MASSDMSMTWEKQGREDAEDADEGKAMTSSYLSNSSPADGKRQERNNIGERILLPKLVFIEGKRYGSSGVLYDRELIAYFSPSDSHLLRKDASACERGSWIVSMLERSLSSTASLRRQEYSACATAQSRLCADE